MQNIKNPEMSRSIVQKIVQLAQLLPTEISIMHICGTHEYTITKNGIRSLLPSNIHVVAGPGCPVCVCPENEINFALDISHQKNTIVCTFGDMIRVPSNSTSLQEAKAQGEDIRVVYSPHDAVSIALQNPTKEIVFFAIGFETTAPLIAFELLNNPPKNFSIICSHKLVLPAMYQLMALPGLKIDGFLLPGHVSAIIGENPYKSFLTEYPIPMVIGGFEINDVLISIHQLLLQILHKTPKVENTYTRIVSPQGNQIAMQMMAQAFRPIDSIWRGLGEIPLSGYGVRPELKDYDAATKFNIPMSKEFRMPKGCRCADVLIGKIPPSECPLFGKQCTPRKPVGPCMVSHEGSCQIAFQFQKFQPQA